MKRSRGTRCPQESTAHRFSIKTWKLPTPRGQIETEALKPHNPITKRGYFRITSDPERSRREEPLRSTVLSCLSSVTLRRAEQPWWLWRSCRLLVRHLQHTSRSKPGHGLMANDPTAASPKSQRQRQEVRKVWHRPSKAAPSFLSETSKLNNFGTNTPTMTFCPEESCYQPICSGLY